MLLTTISMLLLAAAAAAPQGSIAETPPAASVRESFKTAERVFDDRVQRMTDRAPFVLLGSTRGAYLSGYGAVFSLEVNLVPVANVSPFRPAYSAKEIRDINQQKRGKLGVLKAGLRQLLAEQASALAQVPANERIAVIVNLFSFHWEDRTNLPAQLVMQGTRQALLDMQARKAGAEELERAIEVKEF